MNAENFADIISNPSRLYQLSYQELKSLALQYPYCRNLHHLLLLKSHIDHHKEFERTLERTALYSIDREYLYRQLRSLGVTEEEISHFDLAEEYLELHELSSLSLDRKNDNLRSLETLNGWGADSGNQSKDQVAPSAPRPVQPESEEAHDELDALDEALRRLKHAREEWTPAARRPATAGQTPESLQPAPPVPDPLPDPLPDPVPDPIPDPVPDPIPDPVPNPLPDPPVVPPAGDLPAPRPKSAFASWSRQYQPEQLRPQLNTLPGAAAEPVNGHSRKKDKKKDPIIAFAERSLRMNEEVASETLAELLVNQERYERAIQMYERLILIFPEKSGYFAGKIDQLKKLI